MFCYFIFYIELCNNYPQTILRQQWLKDNVHVIVSWHCVRSLHRLCKHLYAPCYVDSSVDGLIFIHNNQLMYLCVLTTWAAEWPVVWDALTLNLKADKVYMWKPWALTFTFLDCFWCHQMGSIWEQMKVVLWLAILPEGIICRLCI